MKTYGKEEKRRDDIEKQRVGVVTTATTTTATATAAANTGREKEMTQQLCITRE